MADALAHLLANNEAWAARVARESPGFFESLAAQQNPEYLWIGCSDSRVPASQIVDLMPGEVFVHRNVANLVPQADLNCLAVIEFAITVLKVRHIIVCGHYGCSGVRAAMRGERHGVLDIWLHDIRDLFERYRTALGPGGEDEAWQRACELNVRHQVESLTRLDVVRDCWKRGQELTLHGWIYSVGDGLLRDLDLSTDASSSPLNPNLP